MKWFVLGLAILLAGCGGDVTLDSRPRDADSAEELARLVADSGDCDGFEYFNAASGYWSFTCQADEHSFTITAVEDEEAKQEVIDASLGLSPMKEGRYFLVQEARYESGRPNTERTLERFPGELVAG